MNKRKSYLILLPMNALILSVFLTMGFFGNMAIGVISENAVIQGRTCIVIDAGHGEPDGGAISHSGQKESDINLDIALRLDDICHLLGLKTKMIRVDENSVYTEGETIAGKKVSDLKARVRTANATQNAILISIHQNYFTDSRYTGAQVFYAPSSSSKMLAENLQQSFVRTLNPNSNRKAKNAHGIYLMQNVKCTAVLVECGFLSNPQEEGLLREPCYQKKLCAVIASVLSTYANT